MNESIIKVLADKYGPLAFGLVSVLMIWFVVVQPQLERSRLDVGALQQITETMRQTSETLKLTADSLERTVRDLESKSK